MKRILALLPLVLTACPSATLTPEQEARARQVGQDLVSTGLAAGEGYLVGGKAGAITYGTTQELRNIQNLRTAAKNPVKVTP